MPTHRIVAREPVGIGSAIVDRSPESIQAHVEDAAHFSGGHADGLARPRDEREVAQLIREATHVLPIGAQSSLTGGATPDGGLVLDSSRLTCIQESGHQHVRVGAGVPLQVLQDWLATRRRWYAPVPTFTGAFAGGVVATNAAGAATFKYGATRAWTDGLTVVLACGHVLDLNRGDIRADPTVGFHIECAHGTRTVKPGSYRGPSVPKCSAGYHSAPDLDLIDLFIGSEGTLGVVTEVIFRVMPERAATLWALVPAPSERVAFDLVAALRSSSLETWARGDEIGIDVAAVEHVDRHCLRVLHDDGVARRHDITIPPDAQVLLLIELELSRGVSRDEAFKAVESALLAGGEDSAIARLCRVLHHHGVFETTEIAWPGDRRRIEAFLAVREAVPTGVNRRVAEAKHTVDARIEKTAADMVVPFDRFADMMAVYREGFERRGLDYAIWGHISDGNVHPNVIPRSFADVVAGRDAILEFGREIIRLGGCPLAEHGVGRSAVKQALLRQLYGEAGIAEMRTIKSVLDPDWKFAPGVLFPQVPTLEAL